MKKITQFFFSALMSLLLILNPIFLSSTVAAVNPPIIVPPPPDVDAKGYVLMDANSGKVIAEKNMNQRMAPASLTKLMTLYIISESLAQGQIKLTDRVRISSNAWKTGGSRMFLKVGTEVPVEQLIQGIIVASGNDACVAMAEYVAGSQSSFAALMNQTAQNLGMKDSHFLDPTGLPQPEHYSTPYDLATLTRAIINQFPQYYPWYKQKWITWNGIKQPNRNRLLWRDAEVDGLKTGHTDDAGYCLISSAKRQDIRLITVVMGEPSDSARANDSQALLNWGFRFYKSYALFPANKPLTTARVWMGSEKYVPFGLAKTLYVTVPAGQYKDLNATMSINPKIQAPIEQGQSYGEVQVTLNGTVIATAPLIALQGSEAGGFWSRLTDHIALMFVGKKS